MGQTIREMVGTVLHLVGNGTGDGTDGMDVWMDEWADGRNVSRPGPGLARGQILLAWQRAITVHQHASTRAVHHAVPGVYSIRTSMIN